jgi:hypothetical protein
MLAICLIHKMADHKQICVSTRRDYYIMEICKTDFNSNIHESLKDYHIIRGIKRV